MAWAVALLAVVVLAGCQTSPLDNPTGTRAGLAATATSRQAAARAVIAGVTTAGRGPRTGYGRDQFGPSWTDDVSVPLGHNGCDTRNDVLRRDLLSVTTRPGTHDCVILSGRLVDPYTARTIDFAKAQATKVQIDHVVPLSYAWQLGAARWTAERRTDFANDPLNLLAVDGPTNESKSDSGPASWLPPNTSVRCSYAVRFAQVARRYRLPVTSADKAMMADQSGG